MEHLRQCRYYLETKPREEYLKLALEDLEWRLKSIDGGFKEWYSIRTHIDPKKAKLAYNTECGVKKLKKQVETLKYLLE